MSKNYVFLLLSLLPFLSKGQSFYAIRHDRPIQAHIGTGVSTYYGDLNNPGDVIDTKLNITVGAQYTPYINFLENRLHTRADLTWFRLKGSDAESNSADRIARNLSFFSNNIQLTASAALDFFPQASGIYGRPFFNFYGIGGIGLLYMNPKTEYQGKKVALQPLQTEGTKYSRFQFVIPYGLGFRIKTGDLHNVAVEAVWYKTFTDHLDDASLNHYPDPNSLSSDLAIALSDRRLEINPSSTQTYQVGRRGNPNNNDSYMLFNVRFELYLATKMSQRTNFNSIYRKKRKNTFNPKRR